MPPVLFELLPRLSLLVKLIVQRAALVLPPRGLLAVLALELIDVGGHARIVLLERILHGFQLGAVGLPQSLLHICHLPCVSAAQVIHFLLRRGKRGFDLLQLRSVGNF